MKAYNLKSVVRRGSMLTAAFVIAGASLLPFTSVSADELNPLTDRSLTLTSGSPGWAFTDGSGNAEYAPPNSGANGQKTGNTFAFKVSSDSTANSVQAITFQYCTYSAGICMGPGDIADHSQTNAANVANKKSDLEVVTASPSEATFGTYVDAVSGNVTSVPAPGVTGSNFIVYWNNAGTWEASTGWEMAATVRQDATEAGDAAGTVGGGTSTGKANFITLSNELGGLTIPAGTEVKVVFFGTNSNYITNPGSEEFFVKINTFSDEAATTKVDGGVTVANVMNESIQITTKVLETMDFSVGTVDPFTLEAVAGAPGTSELFDATGRDQHVPCEPILRGMTPGTATNVLQLGNEGAEFSLETTHTYSTHSYWRLSSNSSAGATVYYSGVTLSNTVGDKIDPIYAVAPNDGLKRAPALGMEQFGLALANGTSGDYEVDYKVERNGTGITSVDLENAADNTVNTANTSNGVHASVIDDAISNLDDNASYHQPKLYPLLPETDYSEGAGVVNTGFNTGDTVNTKFAFSEQSNTIPVAIATENDQVVDCVTGKMRYIANIASTTPAGIYTTKINYIAAPQY